MAVWTTYGAAAGDDVLTGMAEDVSDIITNISPPETPFQTTIGAESTYARLFEWQEDALDAVTQNSNPEGADPTEQTLVETVMRSNVCQILEKTVLVSATADTVRKYGRATELGYQLSKKGAELKRDLEYNFVGTGQTSSAGTEAAPTRLMSGYQVQVGAANIIDAGIVKYGTAPNPLSEEMILDCAEAIYNSGGYFSVLMLRPSDSQLVANFAYATGRERDYGTGRSLVNVIDLYVSPYGQMSVIINRFIRGNNSGDSTIDALIYEPDAWAKVSLRPWARTTLAKTGDNTKVQIVGEMSLKHNNFLCSGFINDIDT